MFGKSCGKTFTMWYGSFVQNFTKSGGLVKVYLFLKITSRMKFAKIGLVMFESRIN